MKRSARWLGVLVAGAVAWGGCKKSEPAPVAAPVASAVPDAGAAPQAEVAKVSRPLRFTDVKVTRQEDRKRLTYTLTNPGTAQARGTVCLSLQDAQGWNIRVFPLGPMTVKGSASDTFTDEVLFLKDAWAEARSLRLFTASGDCTGSKGVTSEVLRLSVEGGPAPAGTPEAREVKPGTAADFELSSASVTSEFEVVRLFEYTVKNRRDVRLAGELCLRMFADPEGQRLLSEQEMGELDVPPKATRTLLASTNVDLRRWDAAARLGLYVSKQGCVDAPGGDNPGIVFRKSAEEPEPGTPVLDVQMDDIDEATDPQDDLHEDTSDDTAGSEQELDPP